MKHRLLLLAALLVSLTAAAPPTMIAQTTDEKPASVIAGDLQLLADEYADHLAGPGLAAEFTPSQPLMRTSNGFVAVDVLAEDPLAAQAALESLGMHETAVAGYLVAGNLPIERLTDLNGLPGIRFVRPSYVATAGGRTTSQGDRALRSDIARQQFGLNGSGVDVGTLSDSYDCVRRPGVPTAAEDVASNDLPTGVRVLREMTCDSSSSDEGRGMMQIIHDLAPGARQIFHTALTPSNEPGFAAGIRALADAGADVIVDDIIYFAEPMFQDGMVAQAVDEVVARGVAYFSAAGNTGKFGYQSAFRSGQSLRVGTTDYLAHDFDPGSGVDIYQQIVVPASRTVTIVLQWDEPYFSLGGTGSRNDVDLMLFANPPGSLPLAASLDNNIGGDPVEVLSLTNRDPQSRIVNLFIGKALDRQATPDPGQLRYVMFSMRDGVISEYSDTTNNSTIYGHASARGALAVGAAFYRNTPAFGVSPPQVETFSSLGNSSILLETNGSRKIQPEVRAKPDFVAANGANTTFFPVGGSDPEGDGFPNFFGTSAAAPHAAAVAALMLQARPGLTPAELTRLLRESSVDMATPGTDNSTGTGLLQADQALSLLTNADLKLTRTLPSSYALLERPFTYTLTLANKGAGQATTVVFSETLPAQLPMSTLNAPQGVVCTISSTTTVCRLAALDPGAAVTVTLTVSPTVQGSFTLRGIASSATAEQSVADNSVEQQLTVVRQSQVSNLAVGLAVNTTRVEKSQPLTYTLTIRNDGPAIAMPVTVTHTMTPGVLLLRSSGSGWSCTSTSNVITCSRPSLTATVAPALTLVVSAPPTGALLTSEARVSSPSPELDLSDNLARVAVIVEPRIYLPLVYR